MRFSTKAEYGLRAILHLAKTKQPVSLASIAKKEGLSLAYLERLFAKLKKAGLVSSFIGVKGGYILTKESNKITVAEVVKALEGSLYQMKCQNCAHDDCRIHSVWSKLYAQIYKTLNSITLKSLLK
jgi:Rrf2 family transcriptional regulator, iron-sulfur cluster assembly transcription factor